MSETQPPSAREQARILLDTLRLERRVAAALFLLALIGLGALHIAYGAAADRLLPDPAPVLDTRP
jgi:hypothetical protein